MMLPIYVWHKTSRFLKFDHQTHLNCSQPQTIWISNGLSEVGDHHMVVLMIAEHASLAGLRGIWRGGLDGEGKSSPNSDSDEVVERKLTLSSTFH